MKAKDKVKPETAEQRNEAVLASAKALFEADAARSGKWAEEDSELPTWDNIPQEARVTYIRIAAERRFLLLPEKRGVAA